MNILHKLVFVLSRNGREDADLRVFAARLFATGAVVVPFYLVDGHFDGQMMATIGQGIERFMHKDFESEKRVALAAVYFLVLAIMNIATRGVGASTTGKIKENLLFAVWTFTIFLGAPVGAINLGHPLLLAAGSIVVTVAYALLSFSMVPEEERG